MLLLLQLAAAADTLLVQQLPPVRSTFEQIIFVASGLTSIATLVLMVAVILMLGTLRRNAIETKAQVGGLVDDTRELIAAAHEIVAESRETVVEAGERVRDTVDNLADRVDEMSELLGRITKSANRVAAVASTAIGGIKLGARAFGFGKKKKRKKSTRPERAASAERPRVRRRD